jgi:hypothetical protein
MIVLINASAIRPDTGSSKDLSATECMAYLQRYAGSKMQLWIYDRSHSKLVVRASKVPPNLAPIDIVFSATDDVRSPAFWESGAVEIQDDSRHVRFVDRNAGVAIIASDFGIVVQDGYPTSIWEFQPFSQNA